MAAWVPWWVGLQLLWGLTLVLLGVHGVGAQQMTPGMDTGRVTLPGPGTTYYVSSSTGSDRNRGTSPEGAWQTLRKVNTTPFQPGDTILFHRGDTWTKVNFAIKRSGTAAKPITYGAYGVGARPVLKGHGTVNDLMVKRAWIVVEYLHFADGETIRIKQSQHITLRHSEFEGAQNACLKVYHFSSHTLITHNLVHNCGQYFTGGTGEGSGIDANGEGIYIGSSPSNLVGDTTHHITVRGNEVYHTTDDHIDIKESTHHITVENNILHSSTVKVNPPFAGAVNITKNAGAHIVVHGNVIHSMTVQAGIMGGGVMPRIYNNLLYNLKRVKDTPQDKDAYGVLLRTAGSKVYHNTIVNLDGEATHVERGLHNVEITNNIGPSTAHNISAATPGLFTDPSTHTYTLAAGSPAIGKGTMVSSVLTDIMGLPRVRPPGSGVDYGAYSHTPLVTVPPHPLLNTCTAVRPSEGTPPRLADTMTVTCPCTCVP